MKCMNSCPRKAIETAHGYTFMLWWIAFSVIPYNLIKLLNFIGVIPDSFYHAHFDLLFNSCMFITGLITVYAGYRILHAALGIKLVNKIATYTSLSYYKFWRRYKLRVKKEKRA